MNILPSWQLWVERTTVRRAEKIMKNATRLRHPQNHPGHHLRKSVRRTHGKHLLNPNLFLFLRRNSGIA